MNKGRFTLPLTGIRYKQPRLGVIYPPRLEINYCQGTLGRKYLQSGRRWLDYDFFRWFPHWLGEMGTQHDKELLPAWFAMVILNHTAGLLFRSF
jgi:hypothetical protein